MASPPRRMTRARARKEGYEPDWRINPHWKTPRKPKVKATRFVLADSTNEAAVAGDQATAGEKLQRVPSPVKIRVAAKLPPPPSVVETNSRSTATTIGITPSLNLPTETSPRKSVNLGSPARVRPRSEIVYTAADKENSPSAIMLAKWASAGKSTNVPKTAVQPSRARPLEASPSNINTHPQAQIVKVLSTPVRVPNPQTPGRNLGTARRIPVKAEQTKPTVYKLNPTNSDTCPDSHRDFSYRVNNHPTPSARSATTLQKPSSPLKAQHPGEGGKPRSKATKTLDVLQLGDMELSDSIHAQSPQVKSWIPLKPGPSFQRPVQDFSRTPIRPSKNTTLSHTPARPATKRDFYVDGSLSVPLHDESDSVQRASTSVPKFPIRRRSVSQSSFVSGKSTSTPRTTSNPTRLDSLEELKPIPKTETWKTPMKGPFHPPMQSIRKVCFRTPSMETPENEGNNLNALRKSFSILTLATPAPIAAPEVSTTPLETPDCSSSPKVFDLSDADDSFQLFTPRKPRLSSPSHVAYSAEPTQAVLDEQGAEIQPPLARDLELETVVQKDNNLATVTLIQPRRNEPLPTALRIPKGTARPSGNQRDFNVPLKPAHLETRIVTLDSQSAHSSAKSNRRERDTLGTLRGVVAFVDVKTADGDDASAPFAESLKSLGAKVVKQWGWNGEELDKIGITHVIFKQGGPRTLSKVKMAKGLVKCVGLGWIARFVSR